MEALIEILTTNPLYLVILVLLTLFAIYSLVKKVIKLFIFVLVLLAIYVGYLAYTGRTIPTDTESLKETLKEDASKAKQGLKNQSDKIINEAKKELKESLKDEASKTIDNLGEKKETKEDSKE